MSPSWCNVFGGHKVSIGIPSDINVDHLAKVVSTRMIIFKHGNFLASKGNMNLIY